jgi:transcriptional regulator with GAF, ATPase, and Fis domain
VLKINKLNDNVGLVSVNKRPSLDNGSGRKNFKFLDEIDSLNINLSRLLSKVSHRNHLKDLVIAIFNEYVHLTRKNVNSFIDGALKKSGSFSGSDRVSILISMKDKIDPEISFEWHADGIDSLIKNTRDIPAGGVKWLFDKLKAEGMFYLETMEDLPPEQEQLKKILRGAGTKSLLSIGMFFGNSIIGILSFGTVIEEKKWSSDDIELLRNISGILASVIIRLKHGIATGI